MIDSSTDRLDDNMEPSFGEEHEETIDEMDAANEPSLRELLEAKARKGDVRGIMDSIRSTLPMLSDTDESLRQLFSAVMTASRARPESLARELLEDMLGLTAYVSCRILLECEGVLGVNPAIRRSRENRLPDEFLEQWMTLIRQSIRNLGEVLKLQANTKAASARLRRNNAKEHARAKIKKRAKRTPADSAKKPRSVRGYRTEPDN